MRNLTILIVGLTSLGDLGSFETQLGNVAILVSMLNKLNHHLPTASIITTIQVSDGFCASHGVSRVAWRGKHHGRLIRNGCTLAGAVFDLLRASVWRLLPRWCRSSSVIRGRVLDTCRSASLILDFNGDIFPSDTHFVHVVVHLLRILTAKKLGVPVVEFANSPGPFNNWYRRLAGKLLLNAVDLIINREPISSGLVRELAVPTPILDGACPAFCLDAAPVERTHAILCKEGIQVGHRPLIGVTLAGYNLVSQRTWDTPKTYADLENFVPVLGHLLERIGADVLLIPHTYHKNPWTGYHIQGLDYAILARLMHMVGKKGQMKLVEGTYSAAEVKGLIGKCDMFIAGRLHAGIAALSQGIPTVLIAYGHKHYGIAELVGQPCCVCDGTDPAQTVSLVAHTWEHRDTIRLALQQRLPGIRMAVDLMFKILAEVTAMGSAYRVGIAEKLEAWAGAFAINLHRPSTLPRRVR